MDPAARVVPVRLGRQLEAAVAYTNVTRQQRRWYAPFLLVATQRTGSAWIMKSLLSRSFGLGECRLAGQYELFMHASAKQNTSDDWWTLDTQRDALAALYDQSAPVTPAVVANAPVMFEKLLNYTRGLDHRWTVHPFGYGFKWMTNQGMNENWDWFLGLARARRIKLVFLRRRDYLRMAVSKYHNLQFRAHPTEKEAEVIRHAPVVLPGGDDLLKEMDEVDATFAHINDLRARARRAGVSTLDVVYEDFVRDYDTYLDVWRYVTRDLAWDCNVTTENIFKTHRVVVHPDPPSTYIANWPDVRATLAASKYAALLDDAEPPRDPPR